MSKAGYGTWHKTAAVEPGQQIEAALNRRVTVTINALSDEYGEQRGVPGISVSINHTTVGKTDAKGTFAWTSDKDLGKKVPIALSASGYLPESWQGSITLDGEVRVQRYFYPVTPRPIRTGIYRFAGNTPNVDLRDVLTQTEDAIAAQLFKNVCFSKVPSQTLQSDMKRAKVSIEKVTTKGWRTTPLKKTVDMIVVGSVAKDDKGYLIEAKFYAPGGTQIISQIARAKSASDIDGAAKEIVNAVIERFPFEGTVVGTEEERYRINLGKSGLPDYRGAPTSRS